MSRGVLRGVLWAGLVLLVVAGCGHGRPRPRDRAAAATRPPDPCHQPQLRLRCPDLLGYLPSQLHLAPSSDGRQLLAARNEFVNAGEGPLELRASLLAPGRMRARQVLQARPGGRPVVVQDAGTVALFDTGSRGRYWKYDEAARFELWSLETRGTSGRLVRTGPKLAYCLRDLRPVSRADGQPYAGQPSVPRYGACPEDPALRTTTLGTSVGWTDSYPSTYPQNWIDVTGLSGCFAYVIRADPGGHLRELRKDNNAAGVVVRLPWQGSAGGGCPALTRLPSAAEALRQRPLPGATS